MSVDAWLDSSLYNLRSPRLAGFWEGATIFSRKFRVRGWKRLFVEIADEGFTLGVLGSVLLLALAMPALKKPRKTGELG